MMTILNNLSHFTTRISSKSVERGVNEKLWKRWSISPLSSNNQWMWSIKRLNSWLLLRLEVVITLMTCLKKRVYVLLNLMRWLFLLSCLINSVSWSNESLKSLIQRRLRFYVKWKQPIISLIHKVHWRLNRTNDITNLLILQVVLSVRMNLLNLSRMSISSSRLVLMSL